MNIMVKYLFSVITGILIGLFVSKTCISDNCLVYKIN